MMGRSSVAKLTLVYVICAGLWVIVAGVLIDAWVDDPGQARSLALGAGLLLVGCSGFLLHRLLRPQAAMVSATLAIGAGASSGTPESRQRLAAAAFEQSSEGIIIADAQRRIVMVNPAFTVITGYTEVEALGRTPRMLASGKHDAAFYADMWNSIERTGAWQGEIWNRRKDGSLYAQLLSVTRVSDPAGRVRNYVGIFADITERERAVDQVQKLAHYDPLTGLPNRALLTDRAGQALSLAQRERTAMAVLFLDLDYFKTVNDSLGHHIGDLLLIEVAKRLLSAVREHDTVSRQGGDEFVVILPGTGAAGAAHVAEKIRELIATPFLVEQHRLQVTTSIGISLFPDDGGDFESLAAAADIAMYRVKQQGRNGYRFYNPVMKGPSPGARRPI